MRPYRILVTGSREWKNAEVIRQVLCRYVGVGWDVTVVNGGARGADALANEIAEQLGMKTEVYIADWGVYGKAAGPRRNKHMVSLGADICIAFPLGESRGTRYCMKIAEAAGIPVINLGDQ